MDENKDLFDTNGQPAEKEAMPEQTPGDTAPDFKGAFDGINPPDNRYESESAASYQAEEGYGYGAQKEAEQQDFNDGEILEDECMYPRVEPTDNTEPESARQHKHGLRNFFVILIVMLILAGAVYVGYLLGIGNSTQQSRVELNLESKPENTEMLNEAQVFENVDKSVVGISVYNSSKSASASGVVYSSDGYIVTNDHIYDDIGGAKFIVYTGDGKEYDAVFVAGDVRSDLAVIKIVDKVNLTPAVFGDSSQLYVGEPVVAVGRPTGADTSNNITSGIVSLLDSRVSNNSSYSAKALQTNAAINPGSSGGGLFNMYGQVVGITSSKIAGSAYEGMGFAIPSTTVKAVVDSLINNGYVKDRAKLGISYQDMSSAIYEANGYTRGLRIAQIATDSGLYGKVEVGDIITAVNGVEITDADIVLDIIDSGKSGDTIVLTVTSSNGSKRDVTAKLIQDNGSSSYSDRESDTTSSDDSANSMPEFAFPYGD